MTQTLEMKEITVDGVKKYSISFPLQYENGTPILDRHNQPRVTNLIADSPEQLVAKIAESNIEISRMLDHASHRITALKNAKPQPRQPAPDLKPKPMTDEERVQLGLDVQDPRKAAAALEKVVESAIGPVRSAVEGQGKTLDLSARREIARQFCYLHRGDYNPIEANGVLMNQWLAANDLEYSLENLEIAFAALQDQLAKKKVVAAPNDPPPLSESPSNAPGNEPPNPGNPPPKARTPVGGISNSQATGRPAGGTPVLTRQQALDMLYKQPSEYERWMRDPKLNLVLNAALAGR